MSYDGYSETGTLSNWADWCARRRAKANADGRRGRTESPAVARAKVRSRRVWGKSFPDMRRARAADAKNTVSRTVCRLQSPCKPCKLSAQNQRPERSSYRRPLRRRVQRRENIFIQRSRARPRVCSISDTLSRAAHGLQDVQLTRLLRQYGADKGVWHKECTTTCLWSSTLDCLVLDKLCSETAPSTPRSPRE